MNTHKLPVCSHHALGGKAHFLLVPLGHLLTQALDLTQFGLRGDLSDALHRDAFKEHRTLDRNEKSICLEEGDL